MGGSLSQVTNTMRCEFAPDGTTWDVVSATYPVTDTPRRATGPFEFGVAGRPFSFGPLLGGDAQGLGLQAIATSARVGTMGDTCGYGIFAYGISLGL